MFDKKLKIGDKIILQKSRNNYQKWEGHIFEILSVRETYYNCRNLKIPGNANIYYNGNPKDEFCLADRKGRLEYFQGILPKLQKECVDIEKQIKELKKFPTEEDAVAYKISEIMRTKGNAKAIAAILKEMKTSDYL